MCLAESHVRFIGGQLDVAWSIGSSLIRSDSHIELLSTQAHDAPRRASYLDLSQLFPKRYGYPGCGHQWRIDWANTKRAGRTGIVILL